MAVGDVEDWHVGFATGGVEAWIEVEVMGVDDDPDDPQTTDIRPMRYAYVINNDTGMLPDLGAGAWNAIERSEASPDRDSLVWHQVPAPHRNRTYSSDLVVWTLRAG